MGNPDLPASFDPAAKEAQLRAESEQWDTSAPVDAQPGDIPVIDIAKYLTNRSADARLDVATKLAHACETVGFWQLTGHGIGTEAIAEMFDAARAFHALPVERKSTVRMDRPDWPLGGVGYLPIGNRKLPARSVANANEAFIIKRDATIGWDDNQWLDDTAVPGFRSTVETFGIALENLVRELVPLYATALGLRPDWFDPAFEHPLWRLRMTRYPAAPADQPTEGHGINPHVDTTFFTLLLQDSPGLTLFHTPSQQWMNVPVVPDAFVVNSGELLRQWTNDRYLSVRHFANASTDSDRHSIPFFVNASGDYVMECVPTCWDDDNPPRYPPISYNQSQAVVQGE